MGNKAYTTTKGVDCAVLAGTVFGVTAKDTDGDGLVDSWEKHGYDHDGDGVVDVDLPALGANPKKKDIFVQIDYMVGGDHTHKPIQAGIDMVVESFANAPVSNPDGTKGINLHVDVKNALAHQATLSAWTGFDALREVNLPKARLPIYHYCVFAHDVEGHIGMSGISKGIPGSGFIVSLGSWTDQVGTTQEQAGTFMHEFGHNIGLRHGGINHVNYKPNYVSIMNYFFQVRGLTVDGTEGHFDYSRHKFLTLKESALKENHGIGTPTNYGTRWYDPSHIQRSTTTSKPIDWDWSGSTSGTAALRRWTSTMTGR